MENSRRLNVFGNASVSGNDAQLRSPARQRPVGLVHGSLSSTRYNTIHQTPRCIRFAPPWPIIHDPSATLNGLDSADRSKSQHPSHRHFLHQLETSPIEAAVCRAEDVYQRWRLSHLFKIEALAFISSPSRPLIGPIIGAYRRILVSGPPSHGGRKMCATDAIDLGVLRPSRFPAFQARGCPCCRSAAGGRERRWCERHRIR